MQPQRSPDDSCAGQTVAIPAGTLPPFGSADRRGALIAPLAPPQSISSRPVFTAMQAVRPTPTRRTGRAAGAHDPLEQSARTQRSNEMTTRRFRCHTILSSGRDGAKYTPRKA